MTASYPGATPTTVLLRGNLVDNLATYLTAGITPSDTTLLVDDTTDWPSAGLLSIRGGVTGQVVELCSYTGKTANSFTGVTRNFNGRLNQAWSENDTVELLWAADMHNRHVEETIALATDLRNAISADLTEAAPGTTAASITARLNQLAYQLGAIIGGDWKAAPAATIAAIDTALDTAVADIAALQTTVGGHTTTLGTYGTRLTDLEKYQLALLYPAANVVNDNKIAVSAGWFVKSDGSGRVSFAGGQSPAFSPVTANSRIDLLTIDDTGTLGVTQGTQAASPTVPAYPTNKQVIAHVLITETGTAVISQADITDARQFLNLGGGTGGVTNYASTFETVAWAVYNDSAAAPVDGTGGSATVTMASTTTNPLRGGTAMLFTKPASNVQGQGASFDFTIDRADKGNMVSVSFDYEPASAYTDDSLAVYIYDVTNATIIQPTPYLVKQSLNFPGRFVCVFQANYNSTSYRLILHIPGTSTTGWTMTIDNLVVGPQRTVYGVPATEWVSYTPTATNLGAGSGTFQAKWRRVGDSAEVLIYFIKDGTPGSGAGFVYFSCPPGLALDLNKHLTTNSLVGIANIYSIDVASQLATAAVEFRATDTTRVAITNLGGGDDYTGADFRAGSSAMLRFTYPVSGWGAGVAMSDQADTRVVAARYQINSTPTITNTASIIDFPTKVHDTHGAVTTGASWKFTAPVAGFYRVNASLLTASYAHVLDNAGTIMSLYKNGVEYARLDLKVGDGTATYAEAVSGATILQMVAGDYIDIRVSRGSALSNYTLQNVPLECYIDIDRLSGPAVVMANETIAARYSTTAGQTISSGGTTINYDTKEFDTHGAVATGASWKFTAPAAGIYRVSVMGRTASQTVAVGSTQLSVMLRKNGSDYAFIDNVISSVNSAVPVPFRGSALVQLNAGDYIDVQANPGVASVALSTNAMLNHINVERINK